MAEWADTAYRRLLDLCVGLSGVAVCALTVLIVADVIGRNSGLGNVVWLHEVAEYALYGVTFLAAPWVLNQGAHVAVDLVVGSFPEPARTIGRRVSYALGAAIAVMVCYYGVVATADAVASNAVKRQVLVIGEWWLLWLIPFSSALMTVEFVRRLTARRPDDEPAEGPQFPPEGL